MSVDTCSHMFWHVLSREFHSTAYVVEVTVDDCQAASIELFLWQWICVEVLIKLSQFPRPLTPVFLVATSNFQAIERLLVSRVREIGETFCVASWTRLVFDLDSLDTSFAVLLSTTWNLIWFSNNLETNWTTSLEMFRWRLEKLAVKSHHILYLSPIALQLFFKPKNNTQSIIVTYNAYINTV